MSTILVVYYSNTGSNKYVAERIAHDLECDIERIRPRLPAFPMILMSSFLKISAGIKPLQHNLADYEKVILCGPVAAGQFLAPLRDFVKKYRQRINKLYFATNCGSSDKHKDGKFGYGKIFTALEQELGDKLVFARAFPIALVIPQDKQDDADYVMKTRLSDENFKGEIAERLDGFVAKVKL
ncbi:MAG: hypothetical protein GF398_15210 [Chitinivibrionales bacterium]|nr:hypothetical protein [Chitinivibrionales bacterium]